MNSNKLPARIVANVFIWVLFAVGSGHIVSTQDYILGYCLSWLMLGEYSPPPLYICGYGQRLI